MLIKEDNQDKLKEILKEYEIFIDEAGRGCIAGSMYFAGIKVKKEYQDLVKEELSKYSFIKDSKKVSKKNRDKIDEIIKEINFKHKKLLIDVLVIESSPTSIDRLGISECIKNSLDLIISILRRENEKILYDGNTNYGFDEIDNLVKADDKCIFVSVASLVAKHKKDLEMEVLNEKYPDYEFIKHNGYVTKRHKEIIKEKGYIKDDYIYRQSYKIKEL